MEKLCCIALCITHAAVHMPGVMGLANTESPGHSLRRSVSGATQNRNTSAFGTGNNAVLLPFMAGGSVAAADRNLPLKPITNSNTTGPHVADNLSALSRPLSKRQSIEAFDVATSRVPLNAEGPGANGVSHSLLSHATDVQRAALADAVTRFSRADSYLVSIDPVIENKIRSELQLSTNSGQDAGSANSSPINPLLYGAVVADVATFVAYSTQNIHAALDLFNQTGDLVDAQRVANIAQSIVSTRGVLPSCISNQWATLYRIYTVLNENGQHSGAANMALFIYGQQIAYNSSDIAAARTLLDIPLIDANLGSYGINSIVDAYRLLNTSEASQADVVRVVRALLYLNGL